MKIEVKYTRLGCLWTFVETLTLYHFSHSEEDVKNWLSWTGGDLSEDEKQALSDLAKVSEKINQGVKGVKGSSWKLDQAFVASLEQSAWEKVSALTTGEELDIIQKAIKLLEPRFNKIWPDEFIRLADRQRVLEKGFNDVSSDRIVQTLTKFFNSDSVPEKVEVFLLLNTRPPSTQGGANLGIGQITLHCSHSDPVTYERFAGIIWHEITHLFQQSHYHQLEDQFVPEIKKPDFWEKRSPKEYSVISEALVSSMSHYGYIDRKFLNEDLDRRWEKNFGEKWRYLPAEFNSWGFYSSYHLQPTVDNYISEGKSLDEEFMNKLLKVWEEYQRFCLSYLSKDLKSINP